MKKDMNILDDVVVSKLKWTTSNAQGRLYPVNQMGTEKHARLQIILCVKSFVLNWGLSMKMQQ